MWKKTLIWLAQQAAEKAIALYGAVVISLIVTVYASFAELPAWALLLIALNGLALGLILFTQAPMAWAKIQRRWMQNYLDRELSIEVDTTVPGHVKKTTKRNAELAPIEEEVTYRMEVANKGDREIRNLVVTISEIVPIPRALRSDFGYIPLRLRPTHATSDNEGYLGPKRKKLFNFISFRSYEIWLFRIEHMEDGIERNISDTGTMKFKFAITAYADESTSLTKWFAVEFDEENSWYEVYPTRR